MPTYTFVNEQTGEEWTDFMTISQREEYLKNNEHIKQVITSAAICDPTRVGVTSKPDNGFRDVLKKIKRNFRGSSINTF